MNVKFFDIYKAAPTKKKIFISIIKSIKNNNFIGGEEVKKFEDNFSKFIGIKNTISVGNGTDALEIAIKSLNLKKGSEVIIPVNTWISTAEAVIANNLKLKFCDINLDDYTINIKDLVDITLGLSGAQIENLLNEAMLNALRYNREKMSNTDIDTIMNKMMAGWQPNDHQFTSDIIDHIAIHEMGHAVVGMLAKHHSKMTKVIINLSSPKSPAYTVFEGSTSSIYTREALFEHLAILLAGRIAEEVFYDVSVTTGAINDFEEAFKLAEKMIVYYGMGKKIIYPSLSETYKEKIDNEVFNLINDAYAYSEFIIKNSKLLIFDAAQILKKDKILTYDTLVELIESKYKNIFDLKYNQ
jgi:ATP-dependent Zn protease